MLFRSWFVVALTLVPIAAGCHQAGRALAPAQPSVHAQQAHQAPWSPAQAEVALGLRLFMDPRLSRTGRVSCAGCHQPRRAFADNRPVGVGVDGKQGTRNTPTVLGAKHSPAQFWDGRAATLEEQALGPIQNPLEMDMPLDELVRRLERIPMYPRLFEQAYGTGVTTAGVATAIAAFERALEHGEAPYDRHLAGDATAISASAKRGAELFNGKARCATCHRGPDFTDYAFHNTGWGMDAARPDSGRFGVTGRQADRGAFKTPSLRNVALTAPYFHDGEGRSLDEVVAFYDRGGRPNAQLDPKLRPLGLSAEEKKDLVAFLETLTTPNNFKAIAKEAVEKREVRL